MPSANVVLQFWFDPVHQAYWFARDDGFDEQIRHRFAAVWQQAAQGALSAWRVTLHGRLAEIIVLDQFSRNLFRQQAQAFAQDGMALVLAQEAVRQPGFADLAAAERQFMLLPLMHSESLVIHRQAEALFAQHTDPVIQDFEHRHRAIIEQFGRYPHRNAALGRISTEAERLFLQQPGSAF